ncbi:MULTISPECIES: fumarylacetoacetate hydrolase family protein [Streptomyces]|uniref:fumarylacetoacetate hydrolase family protein n=1 Tax=Streptomyces lycopersici TaxID=2974589 RepID=UPI0021D1A3F8|nr:fumarylacetoacetate hydrolase family protein [Streptomyces sp. NEAU-383]
MTRIVRFADEAGTVRTGVADDAGGIRAFPGALLIGELLRLPAVELRALVENTTSGPAAAHEQDVLPLPPLDGLMELWAAGVTYERSREARVEESTEQSVYERIYDAERPELFFKSPAWRVVTDGEPIAVRDDSELNVPEPELALVLNRHGETVGYLVADDVSSRSIEGENPLYLPQAKIYAGSAAVSSAIVPAWEIDAPDALDITMAVWRDGEAAYQAATSTAAFHRTPRGLVDHLWHSQPFPDGAVLSTGTGIVPALDFTLRAGDVVEISIEGVGVLRNPVRAHQSELDWLVEAIAEPLTRRAHRSRFPE